MLPDRKNCIWRAVFFVRILCFETSEPFEFDKKLKPGSVLSVQIDERSYEWLSYSLVSAKRLSYRKTGLTSPTRESRNLGGRCLKRHRQRTECDG